MNQITFQFNDAKCALRNRLLLKEHILSIFKKYRIPVESVTYIFCSDAFLLEINRQFLNHDYFTDIITFDLSVNKKIVSEIYISVDRVKENALQHQTSFTNELLRVIFHGILHLCGFKDKRPQEVKLMREAEEANIASYLRKVSRNTVSG